ncbi:ImmA/IrrE family metallo-endopeptidase (plasmid) [Pseudomonas silesiensis]|uniref:ImmA/IrrE family metallo-endopeptidase n=1 Tax=Pseudomonas silesiensis TaxID=1853130 RepID=UPI0030D0025C
MSSKALEMAQKVLDLAWDGQLPVDPVRLASTLRVTTQDADGQKQKCTIVVRSVAGGDLAGASSQVSLEQTTKGSQYVCAYNRDEISYRNRFAVAHELGHILLGHVRIGEPALRHYGYGDSTTEMSQANSFAAALLMPERFLRSVFASIESVQQMGEAFGVSTEAAIYRLKALRLI